MFWQIIQWQLSRRNVRHINCRRFLVSLFPQACGTLRWHVPSRKHNWKGDCLLTINKNFKMQLTKDHDFWGKQDTSVISRELSHSTHLKCHATKRILPWMAQVSKLTSNFCCCLGRDRILSIKKRTNILIVKRGIRRMWKFEELISKKKMPGGLPWGCYLSRRLKTNCFLNFVISQLKLLIFCLLTKLTS